MYKIILGLYLIFITTFSFGVDTKRYITDGEKLVYKGSAPRFIIFGNLGTITIEVNKTKLISKKDAFKIGLTLELDKTLAGLYAYGSKMNSILEYNQFRSLIYNKIDQKSKESRYEKAIFDYDEKEVWYKRYRGAEKKNYDIIKTKEPNILDPLSLIYYLRTLTYKKSGGSSKFFQIFNRGKILKMAVDYSWTTIKIGKKKRSVIHIKPSKATKGALIRKRDVELFIDPKSKIPLLIRILGIPVVGKLELYLHSSNHSLYKM